MSIYFGDLLVMLISGIWMIKHGVNARCRVARQDTMQAVVSSAQTETIWR